MSCKGCFHTRVNNTVMGNISTTKLPVDQSYVPELTSVKKICLLREHSSVRNIKSFVLQKVGLLTIFAVLLYFNIALVI